MVTPHQAYGTRVPNKRTLPGAPQPPTGTNPAAPMAPMMMTGGAGGSGGSPRSGGVNPRLALSRSNAVAGGGARASEYSEYPVNGSGSGSEGGSPRGGGSPRYGGDPIRKLATAAAAVDVRNGARYGGSGHGGGGISPRQEAISVGLDDESDGDSAVGPRRNRLAGGYAGAGMGVLPEMGRGARGGARSRIRARAAGVRSPEIVDLAGDDSDEAGTPTGVSRLDKRHSPAESEPYEDVIDRQVEEVDVDDYDEVRLHLVCSCVACMYVCVGRGGSV